MRKLSLVASALVVTGLVAGCSSAGPTESIGSSQEDIEANTLPRHFPTQDRFAHQQARTRGGTSNLTNHGGPTITTAHVVAIFWGPSWNSGDPISTSLSKYIAAY